MKKVCAVLVSVILCGCAITDMVKIKPPVIEPPVITLPTTTTTTQPPVSTCGCNLSTPLVDPPYTSEQLKEGGNAYECPTVAGRDVRLNCRRANGGRWSLGNLLPKAVSFNGDMMQGKCFEADGGKYHFFGHSRKGDGDDMISAKVGDVWKYETTTFVWYQWRKAE